MSLNTGVSSASLQKGSALVIAVFISVVMLLLVAALSKLLIASSEGVSYEVQGTRSFFAAQSGIEYALTELFPLASATVATSCPGTLQNGEAVNLTLPSTISFNTAGLQSCTAHVSCRERSNTAGEVTHFWLISTGQCGTDEVQTSRTIQMEVWQ
ncbi:pilus assembly PilX N-terminal domain-containing protein [Rheinheimera faecalis]|jgi:MSHA biogenesis protein MshP|uniref:pilus assembly PilX N-terminal domain-containing protein n=1 Tax=Rheinheimera faecalis TaxID=2901141 RepID=UPI001E3B71CD|nr:pilus assembly PilX N-terminal domain-containing protein [Rheinheimera faecalis]